MLAIVLLSRGTPGLNARELSGTFAYPFSGCQLDERRWHRYPFCWSTEIDVARNFAEQWTDTSVGAVVLRTAAPAQAVLLIRSAEGWYDEGEVVVDPFALGVVEVVERLQGDVTYPKAQHK